MGCSLLNIDGVSKRVVYSESVKKMLQNVQTAFSSFKIIMQDAFVGSLVPRCVLVWGMVVRGCACRDLC